MLRVDGLAWMFAMMVLAIGALVVMYAHYYLSSEDSAPRFFGCLLLFMEMCIRDRVGLAATWEAGTVAVCGRLSAGAGCGCGRRRR